MTRFVATLPLGQPPSDVGWDLVPLIMDVLKMEPAWARLVIAKVHVGTARDISGNFTNREDAQAWANAHDHEPLTSFKAEWSWPEERTVMLDINVLGGTVYVWSDSEADAQGMRQLLERKLRAALPVVRELAGASPDVPARAAAEISNIRTSTAKASAGSTWWTRARTFGGMGVGAAIMLGTYGTFASAKHWWPF